MRRSSYPVMILWNGTRLLEGFFGALLSVSGPLVEEFPCPCHQKIRSVGKLCCEAVCTCLAAY